MCDCGGGRDPRDAYKPLGTGVSTLRDLPRLSHQLPPLPTIPSDDTRRSCYAFACPCLEELRGRLESGDLAELDASVRAKVLESLARFVDGMGDRQLGDELRAFARRDAFHGVVDAFPPKHVEWLVAACRQGTAPSAYVPPRRRRRRRSESLPESPRSPRRTKGDEAVSAFLDDVFRGGKSPPPPRCVTTKAPPPPPRPPRPLRPSTTPPPPPPGARRSPRLLQLALTDDAAATSSAAIHPQFDVVIERVTYDRSAILGLSTMPAGASQAAKNEIVLTLLEAYGRGELGNTDRSLDIAQAYVTTGGFRLGKCVRNLRQGRGVDRAMRSDLDSLNFVWRSARTVTARGDAAFVKHTLVLEQLAASGEYRWSKSVEHVHGASTWLFQWMNGGRETITDEDLIMRRDALEERLRWAATLGDKAHEGTGADWAREATAKAKRVLAADRPSAAERAAYKARKKAAKKKKRRHEDDDDNKEAPPPEAIEEAAPRRRRAAFAAAATSLLQGAQKQLATADSTTARQRPRAARRPPRQLQPQLALTDDAAADASAAIHPQFDVVIERVTYDRSAILGLSTMPAGASQAAKNEIVLTLLEAYGRGELGNTDRSLDIAQAYVTTGGFRLGVHVNNLRQGHCIDRAMRSDLDSLNFVWRSPRSCGARGDTAFAEHAPVLEELAASGKPRWAANVRKASLWFTQWLEKKGLIPVTDEDLLMKRDELAERLRWAAMLGDKAHEGSGGDWAREATAKAKRVLAADRPSAAERAAYKARKAASRKPPKKRAKK